MLLLVAMEKSSILWSLREVGGGGGDIFTNACRWSATVLGTSRQVSTYTSTMAISHTHTHI